MANHFQQIFLAVRYLLHQLDMRFESNTKPKKVGLSGRDRLRLWSLMGCLGLVLVAMNQLRKPETIQRLDRVFGVPSQQDDAEQTSTTPAIKNEDTELVLLSDRSKNLAPELPSTESPEIEDNTFFRPAEGPAWFEAFQRLKSKTSDQLVSESLGEITYAQLLEQPDEYRHRVLTMRGTVLREEELEPAHNSIGMDSYHRLWLSPQGGGQWPLVIYCRTLPPKFPRGDNLRETIKVDGEFFKVWSYKYDHGLGLAPVIVADAITWQEPILAVTPDELPVRQLIWAATGTGVFALIVVWLAVRHTARRPRSTHQLPATFQPPDSIPEQKGGGKA